MKKHILALAAAAAMMASPALALTVVQSQTIGAANAPASSTLSFNQFDSSLGSLDSVTLSFTAYVNTSGSLTNTANAQKTYTLTQSALAGLTGQGFDLDATLLSGTSNYTLQGKSNPTGKTAAISLTGNDTDSDTLTSGLAAFIGSGAVDFTFSRAANFSVNPNSVTLSALASIWGDATLTYNYTAPIPAPALPAGGVPEPGVWALMILGFGGVGVALRRGRREGIAAVRA